MAHLLKSFPNFAPSKPTERRTSGRRAYRENPLVARRGTALKEGLALAGGLALIAGALVPLLYFAPRCDASSAAPPTIMIGGAMKAAGC